jgi:hypothetical protein
MLGSNAAGCAAAAAPRTSARAARQRVRACSNLVCHSLNSNWDPAGYAFGFRKSQYLADGHSKHRQTSPQLQVATIKHWSELDQRGIGCVGFFPLDRLRFFLAWFPTRNDAASSSAVATTSASLLW